MERNNFESSFDIRPEYRDVPSAIYPGGVRLTPQNATSPPRLVTATDSEKPNSAKLHLRTGTMVAARSDRKSATPIMAKLLNQKSARKLLEAHGWAKTVGGKHNIKMEKPGQRPITLPMHKGQDYSAGLTQSILKAAGIDRGEL